MKFHYYIFFIFVLISSSSKLWGQEWSTLQFGIRSPLQTNVIYDLYFSSRDNLLYIATNKGLFKFNGITFGEILKTDGEPINGSYIREQHDTIYMKDFSGGLYQIIHDSLHLKKPPVAIKEKITSTYLSPKYVYYITGPHIYVYTYTGQKKDTLSPPLQWF